jgi:hypothetical protein
MPHAHFFSWGVFSFFSFCFFLFFGGFVFCLVFYVLLALSFFVAVMRWDSLQKKEQNPLQLKKKKGIMATRGYVFCIANDATPNIVTIGATRRDTACRLREANSDKWALPSLLRSRLPTRSQPSAPFTRS